MKLKRFLTEESKEEVQEILQRDCKPYLREIGPKRLYRGFKSNIKSIVKLNPRTDRLPSGFKIDYHNILDDLFHKVYKWNVIDTGVFVTSSPHTAKVYGKTYVFFPIGNYNYLWSPNVLDSSTKIETMIEKESSKAPFMDPEFIIKVKQIILSYKNKDLHSAIRSKNEIIFSCKEYYLVNEDIL